MEPRDLGPSRGDLLLAAALRHLGERALVELAVHQTERIRELGAAIAGRITGLQLAKRVVVALERQIPAAERLLTGAGCDGAQRAHALLDELHALGDRGPLPPRVVERLVLGGPRDGRNLFHLPTELLRQLRLRGSSAARSVGDATGDPR